VPSANDSSCLMRPSRLSARSRRAHAISQIPALVHPSWRRQHVAGEGKCLGKSFQRAPLRRSQRMPSKQRRAGAMGRPPWGPGARSVNKSEMRFHCSSVSSKSGSVVDLAGGSAASRDQLAISKLLWDFTYYGQHTTRFS
jgi:hypothetical protein